MLRVERKEGLQPYQATWQQMLDYTLQRDENSPDMLWVLEHDPVYTLGQAGKREHLLNVQDIPVVQTDRGGQVTYHGPGQLVVYILWDLRRAGYFIKEYVWRLEEALIMTLKSLGVVNSQRKPSAPGVYVPNAQGELEKIAALGVKVKQGCTYHGLSLNVDMDLRPFLDINPCGYAGLRTIDLASLGVFPGMKLVEDILIDHLQRLLARSE